MRFSLSVEDSGVFIELICNWVWSCAAPHFKMIPLNSRRNSYDFEITGGRFYETHTNCVDIDYLAIWACFTNKPSHGQQ